MMTTADGSPRLPGFVSLTRFSGRGLLVGGLSAVVLVSALAVVLVQHHVRHLETRLAQAIVQEQALIHDRGRLVLEKHHLTALARVERKAKTELQLRSRLPDTRGQTIVLSLPGISQGLVRDAAP
ncbi:MAG: cell division protein FtsL [Hydrogenovibrio sp.]|uniref:cell division protein FtsL n=1 Tax=Hydrogenovibrio sp. TaxID=2065821 RepID=UPI0028707AEE|nr:cell division protein FtsL [Hydrogenovibrio sp.]MDR9499277.1 cell division protein FtsL [Hydrogenovibrio sp.]